MAAMTPDRLRSLTLIRHAKSSWDHPELQDFDRPLNRRGLKNAPMMGQRLAAANYRADMIISSPARRAITTAESIAAEIGFDPDHIVQNPLVYGASPGALTEVVTGIDDRFRHVALVGHNPGITLLCNILGDSRIDNLPTCGIARMEFDAHNWEDVSGQDGHLVEFDYPKKK